MEPILPTESDLINKINVKVTHLKQSGLSWEDQETLKKQRRLCFIWEEPEEPREQSRTSVTKWRRSRARHAYREIQDASNHLFLAAVLVVTPTECGKTSFQRVLDRLVGLESYDQYHFHVSSVAQKFLESTAAEQGFAQNRYYLDFMQSLFPRPEIRRKQARPFCKPSLNHGITEIQFAYSLIRRDNIPSFLGAMEQAVYSSRQWASEELQGGETSGCVTIFIPTREDEDGSCNIRVDRNLLMGAIHRFKMTKLKLE